MAPQRVDLIVQWTNIIIQCVSAIPVDWSTYAVCTYREQPMNNRSTKFVHLVSFWSLLNVPCKKIVFVWVWRKKNNITSNRSTFSVRNFMWSAPVLIFRSSEQFYIFSWPVAPQRVHLKPQWTGIPIQFVSVTPVDWGPYDTTMN